jgi:hypothetical protein
MAEDPDVQTSLATPGVPTVPEALPPTPGGPPAGQSAALAPAPAAGAQPTFAVPPHQSLVSQIVQGLMGGGGREYRVDPETGKMAVTQEKQKPGGFFRGLLAMTGAALLGGAAAASSTGPRTFAGGLVAGGAAEQQHLEQQDLLKRKQATDDYNEQLKAKEEARKTETEKRETAESKARIDNLKALTATSNIHQIGIAAELTHGSYVSEEAEMKRQAADVADYKAAGVKEKPGYIRIPDSERTVFDKAHPDSIGWNWKIVDMKTHTPADGITRWEAVRSVFDITDKSLPISKAAIDQMRTDGIEIKHPGILDDLKPNTMLSAETRIYLEGQANEARHDQLVRRREGELTAKTEAEINKEKAQTRMYDAEALEKNRGMTKSVQLDKALDELTKTGDFENMTPTSKLIIAKEYAPVEQERLNAQSRALQSAVDNRDPEAVEAQKKVLRQLGIWNDRVESAFRQRAKPVDPSKVDISGKEFSKGDGKYVFSKDNLAALRPFIKAAAKALGLANETDPRVYDLAGVLAQRAGWSLENPGEPAPAPKRGWVETLGLKPGEQPGRYGQTEGARR